MKAILITLATATLAVGYTVQAQDIGEMSTLTKPSSTVGSSMRGTSMKGSSMKCTSMKGTSMKTSVGAGSVAVSDKK